MDDINEKLFAQLGGSGVSAAQVPADQPVVEPTAGTFNQDESLDRWRILMVELAYLLNASFQDALYWEGVKAEKDTFRQFVRIIRELNQMPGHTNEIRIQFRGAQKAKFADKIDYVMSFAEITIDLPAIAALTRRMGLRVKHLEGRLQKSFEAFAAQAIKSLRIKIPENPDNSIEAMRVSLRIISCFHQAVDNNVPIGFDKDGEKFSIDPITDDMGQPDPNLTTVAALNSISSAAMHDLMAKVKKAVQPHGSSPSGETPINIFQAMFSIKSLQQKLLKPPIEINSEGFSGAQTNPAAGSGDASGVVGSPGGQAMGSAMSPGVVKARVAQFVKQAFGDKPENAKKVMRSMYGKDFQTISQEDLGERMILVTDMLRTLEQNPKGQHLMQDVLHRIQGGLDKVPQGLLDDVVVDDKGIRYWSDQGEQSVENVDGRLLNVVGHAKQKSAIQKKQRTVLSPGADFSSQDYSKIAADFGINDQDAEDIITLFKGCFDAQENFLRASFEKKVPDFAGCKKKVFDILWEFLKETQRRSDRLPFLNSLQLLVKEIKNPILALKVLLSDFAMDPAGVEYFDRNAIMLANQFLRTYNKEINMDIEITPEEVLLVIEGLDPSVVNYARWKLDGEQKSFFEKFITIRQRLIDSLDVDSPDAHYLPIRFLLALEREIHIFLSLVGGSSAYTVVRGALNVYGNPASQVYLLKESRDHMTALLQHLAVLIRGFGRLGKQKDLELLEEVKNNEDGFYALGNDARHEALVRRIIGWIDTSKNNISTRSSKEAS
jgi:hypothetical protein